MCLVPTPAFTLAAQAERDARCPVWLGRGLIGMKALERVGDLTEEEHDDFLPRVGLALAKLVSVGQALSAAQGDRLAVARLLA